MAKRVMPNSAATVAIATSSSAAISASIVIAVRLASLIATPEAIAGGDGGVFGKRQAKNSTKAIHGRNTSGMPVTKTSAPCSDRSADKPLPGGTARRPMRSGSRLASHSRKGRIGSAAPMNTSSVRGSR